MHRAESFNVNKILLPVTILNQINPVHNLIPSFLNINFNIIFPP